MTLIGRDDERRALDALLASARLGQAGALVVSGEAGIGKSALLGEAAAAAAASGFLVLRVTGAEAERELPFAALATLLRPLSAGIDGLPGPQARALGVALALRGEESVDRFAVAAAVLGLVTRAAENRPVAVVVDDAHLLDRSTAEALTFTARRLLADRAFVLVAVREGEPEPWSGSGLAVVHLRRLGRDETARLVAALAPAPGPGLTADQRDRAVLLSDGNPLAAVSLANDPSALSAGGGHFPPAVPTLVADAFGRRVAGLGAGVLALLQVVAVAGGDLAVVARVGREHGFTLTGLEPAERRRLVRVVGDRAEFEHPLTRSAVYALATPAAQRRLHGWVADALPAHDLDRRAWHRSAATLGPDNEVAAALEAVGTRAGARGAHAVAVSALEQAARLSVDGGLRAARFLAAGEAAWFAGADDRAPALLDSAVHEDGSARTRSRAGAVAGLVAARTGELERARDLLLAAASEVEGLAPGEALLLYAELVDVCFYLLDTATAAVAAQRVDALLAQSGPHPEREAALARIAVGMSRIFRGEPGAEPIRDGVDALTRLGDAAGTMQSAWEVIGPLFLREAGAGRELVSRAVEQRREAARLGTLPHLLFHLARVDATTDRWTDAEAAYGEAITLAREFGQVTELAASLAGLTWVLGRQGRIADCRARADEVVALTEGRGLRMPDAWVAFALAELDLSTGDVAAAARGFAALETRLRRLDVLDPDLSPVPELVESLLRTDDEGAARVAAAPYVAQARRKGQPWSMARAARVTGMLSPDDGIHEEFDRALAWHARTDDLFELARTELVFGERLRRGRRPAEARMHLRAALTSFERLGARAWAEVALGELRATGATAHRRDLGPVLDLTPRELQIGLLLADGRTTREAAAALFLSPKTVEYHLRHVYTKLGIGSRAELTARLRDLHPAAPASPATSPLRLDV